MRPIRALALALVSAALAARAQASGVNLTWDACSPEGGVANKTFACNSNSGSRAIYGSFVLASDQPSFVGVEVTLNISAETDSLPAWWRLDGCRSSGMSVNFIFDTDPNTSCTDPWNGAGVGGLAAYRTYWNDPQEMAPNAAQVFLGAALPSTMPNQLTAGTEYYCFKLVLASTRTVGSGACEGCSTPVCITLSSVNVVQNTNQHELLTTPVVSNVVTWQSATNCAGANTPHNNTWGQIRSVLR